MRASQRSKRKLMKKSGENAKENALQLSPLAIVVEIGL